MWCEQGSQLPTKRMTSLVLLSLKCFISFITGSLPSGSDSDWRLYKASLIKRVFSLCRLNFFQLSLVIICGLGSQKYRTLSLTSVQFPRSDTYTILFGALTPIFKLQMMAALHRYFLCVNPLCNNGHVITWVHLQQCQIILENRMHLVPFSLCKPYFYTAMPQRNHFHLCMYFTRALLSSGLL